MQHPRRSAGRIALAPPVLRTRANGSAARPAPGWNLVKIAVFTHVGRLISFRKHHGHPPSGRETPPPDTSSSEASARLRNRRASARSIDWLCPLALGHACDAYLRETRNAPSIIIASKRTLRFTQRDA